MIDLRRVLHPFWSTCYWFPANIAFGAWCFPGVGPYHTFLGSTVWFLYEPLGPTVGQLQLPPPRPHKKKKKKKDKCSTNARWRWAWLKLTELLKRGCVRRSRGTLEEGWIWGIFLSREVCVQLDRQCWTDLNSISGVKNLGPGNTRLPEGSNGWTENDCSW